MLVTSALKEECVVIVWSVLMLMLCSFLQFGICRALEYLISHLITLASSAETRQPYQGRGWDFVKIFSISERLTQQWNVSLWNYINNHHYVSAVCLLQSTVTPMWLSRHIFLSVDICMWSCPVWAVPGPRSVWAGHQGCRVTGRRLARVALCHPAWRFESR